MATIWKGAEVNTGLNARIMKDVEALKARGITPTLAIVRVGERPDDLSYERGAIKRAESLGVAVAKCALPVDVTQEVLLQVIRDINADSKIHGVLLFRPLPKHLDEALICNTLVPCPVPRFTASTPVCSNTYLTAARCPSARSTTWM